MLQKRLDPVLQLSPASSGSHFSLGKEHFSYGSFKDKSRKITITSSRFSIFLSLKNTKA
jgi:hypothetical protein